MPATKFVPSLFCAWNLGFASKMERSLMVDNKNPKLNFMDPWPKLWPNSIPIYASKLTLMWFTCKTVAKSHYHIEKNSKKAWNWSSYSRPIQGNLRIQTPCWDTQKPFAIEAKRQRSRNHHIRTHGLLNFFRFVTPKLCIINML